MVFTGVDLDQIDKMVPRRVVKSAPGSIELNQHFGAETDLLDLECRQIEWCLDSPLQPPSQKRY